jgi:hypothetical protein
LFDDGSVSLSTVDGRIRCDLNLPDEENGYQYDYLNHEEWDVTASTLSKRDGEYYLHLGFRKDKPEKQVERQDDDEDRTVLGVRKSSSCAAHQKSKVSEDVDLGIVKSPLPAQRTSHRERNSDTSIESSSGFAAPSSRLVHNPLIGRFSR